MLAEYGAEVVIGYRDRHEDAQRVHARLDLGQHAAADGAALNHVFDPIDIERAH